MQTGHDRDGLSTGTVLSRLVLVLALVLGTVVVLFDSEGVRAQTPRNFRVPTQPWPDTYEYVEPEEAVVQSAAVQEAEEFIIIADPGVDDAVAIAWLLNQQEVSNKGEGNRGHGRSCYPGLGSEQHFSHSQSARTN